MFCSNQKATGKKIRARIEAKKDNGLKNEPAKKTQLWVTMCAIDAADKFQWVDLFVLTAGRCVRTYVKRINYGFRIAMLSLSLPLSFSPVLFFCILARRILMCSNEINVLYSFWIKFYVAVNGKWWIKCNTQQLHGTQWAGGDEKNRLARCSIKVYHKDTRLNNLK